MPNRIALLGVSGPTTGIVPPSGFTPASIYGLEAWYYQPDLDYAAGTWVDQSGNTRNLTQGTAGFRPTLSAALAELNGKYGVTFDGSDDVLETAGFTLTQPWSVLGVFRQVSWTANEYPWDGAGAGGGALYQQTATPRLTMYAGSDGPSSIALPVNRFGVVSALYNGASSRLHVDGPAATGNVGTNNPSGWTLGASGTPSGFSNISGSEFMLYRGIPAAYDLVRLWNEWVAADRYNIPTTFNPTSIATCQLWLRGDDLGTVGAAISSWADQSGNSRNATQGTGANQPLVDIGVNGKKCAKFDGSNDALFTPSFSLSQPFTIAIVAKQTSDNNGFWVEGVSGSTVGLNSPSSTTLFQTYAGTALNSPAGDMTKPFIGIGVFNGVSSASIINGEKTSGDAGANTISGGLGIGSDGAGTSNQAGDIYEILIYSVALTTIQQQQLEGYLANKYLRNAAIRPFDPLSVAGCQGWWRVDGGCDVSVDGNSITTLYDRSGNGRHLTEATNKPLYRTLQLNSLAVARFDGTNDKLAATFGMPTAQSTIISIVKQTAADTTERYVYDGIAVGARHALETFTTNVTRWVRRTDLGTSTFDNTKNEFAVYTSRIGSTALSGMRANSVSTDSTDFAGSTLTGFKVGARYDDTLFWDGDVAEIIIYDGLLSDADVASVEAYLNKFYDTGYKAPNHSTLLSNLKGWWDASQEAEADGAAIATWNDMSGNGNDLTQGTGAQQPIMDTLLVNGRPGIDFDGTADNVDNTGFTHAAGASAATVFVVCQPDAVANQIAVNGGAFQMGLNLDGTGAALAIADGSNYGSVAGVVAGGVTRIWSMVYNGAGATDALRMRLMRDAVPQTLTFTGAIPVTLVVGNGWHVGARYDNAQYFNGKILEVVYLNTALSDSNRRAVENYLGQKYNIAVGY